MKNIFYLKYCEKYKGYHIHMRGYTAKLWYYTPAISNKEEAEKMLLYFKCGFEQGMQFQWEQMNKQAQKLMEKYGI